MQLSKPNLKLKHTHRKSKALLVFALLLFLTCGAVNAQNASDTLQYTYTPLTQEQIDSLIPPELRTEATPDTLSVKPTEQVGIFSAIFKRQNKFTSYLDGLVAGNKDRSFEKKIDFNFVVMPSYTREGSFGIGGGLTGLYRLDKNDSIMQPSDVTLIGNATINGLFSLVASGNTHFPGRKLRLNYKLEYAYSPLNFWGISRDACSENPQVKYTRNQLKFNSDLVRRMTGSFNLGILFDMVYSNVTELDNWDYLEGQRKKYFFTGLGLVMQYDTRDFILQPQNGMNVVLRWSVRPQFLSSYNETLFNISLTYNYYQRLWKGALLALDLYGSFNSQGSPWPLREALGSGGIRMRGYYAGRYIDNNLASAQLEYRQHLFSRFGIALWGGAGNVFSSPGNFRLKDILPTGGIGLRIELKHNVNGRVDFGIGKGTTGFVFAIGEAF